MSVTAEDLKGRLKDLTDQLETPMITAGEQKGRSLSREIGVSTTAVQLAVRACRSHEMLASALGSTPDDVEARVKDMQEWLDVEHQIGEMLAVIRVANRVRRHRVGKMTWQIYHILKQLLRQPEFVYLQGLLDSMQHELGRRAPRRKV